MTQITEHEIEVDRVRRATHALIGMAIAWPVALVAIGGHLARDVSVALPAIACGAVVVALVEAVRHASAVIAGRSWSRPPGASEVTRTWRGLTVAILLALSLVPVLGVLGAFGFDSVTAQVESTRTSYTYRVEYGPVLRSRLRRAVVALCAETTIAAVAVVLTTF
jgi:hypothetical protein